MKEELKKELLKALAENLDQSIYYPEDVLEELFDIMKEYTGDVVLELISES